MFKVLHNFTHLTHQQSNAQNSPSQTSTVYKPRTSDVQGGFRKGIGTRGQIANMCWIIEKARKFQESIYLSFIEYAKALDCVNHSNLENTQRDENTIPHYLPLKNLYAGQEVTEPDMGQQTGSKLGKDYVKVVYCHLAYLTYIQSTSCKMSGQMKHKLESRLPGKISEASDTQMISPLQQKEKKKVKEESEKVG